MRSAPVLWVAAAAAAFALPGQAGVRKCTDAGGRVTFQDLHCPVSSAAAAADASAVVASVARPPEKTPEPAKAESPRRDAPPQPPAHGAWRGAAQFRFVSSTPPQASADAALELELRPDGQLHGGAPDAGCRLDGVHAPERTRNVVAVDIVISGCRDARFNARYAGALDAATPGRSRLRLHAITAASPVLPEGYRELSMATVDAALNRSPHAR